MSRARPTRLVQVTAAGSSADFAVSADSTFAELVDLLAESLGIGPASGSWHVAVGGRVLDPAATLAEAGVIDGDRLDLTTETGPFVRLVDRGASRSATPRNRRFGSATA